MNLITRLLSNYEENKKIFQESMAKSETIFFKTQRQATEWRSPEVSKKIKKITKDFADYVYKHYDKFTIITHIIRYIDDDLPIPSVHQFGRGIDIRSHHLEASEIEMALFYINKKYPYGKDKYKTAIYHNIGFGKHIHIQVKHG